MSHGILGSKPDCPKPATYDPSHPHMGCTDDWCVADPIPRRVDPHDREAVRRAYLAAKFQQLDEATIRRLRRAWDKVK